MKVQAIHRNARMSSRKVRLVARLLSGMPVEQAAVQLEYMPGKASGLILGVLESAVANAIHNHQLDKKTLVIDQVYVDEGLVMKRFRPRSRGMAHPILKRTAHIKVVVSGEEPVKKSKAKKDTKKDAIATISPDEYVTQQQKASEEEKQEAQKPSAKRHQAVEKSSKTTGDSEKSRSVESKKDVEEYAAHEQKRALQQGGNKRTTNRRVSKKEGK